MLKNFAIGQYYNTSSPLHSLDPRVKILSLMVFMVLVFLAQSVEEYVFLACLTVALVILSRVPFLYIIRGLKPVWVLLIFTFAINLFLGGGETVLWSWKILTVTKEAVVLSVSMMARVVILVVLSSILTLTTTAMDMTKGIELLLAPLTKIKFPSREIAMMTSIAMRFIPTLSSEAEKIMKAQAARGNDFESGGIIKKARAMLPLFVPLFISSFRRADELAMAMECRCYHTGERTSFKLIKYRKRDAVAYISVGMAVLCFVALRIAGVLL